MNRKAEGTRQNIMENGSKVCCKSEHRQKKKTYVAVFDAVTSVAER